MLASASAAGAGWSAGASAGPQTVASGSLAAPGTPSTTVTCVQNVSISVGLSWPAAANATSYDVMRATVSGGPYTLVGSSGTTAYTDTTVAQQKTYYYVVVAKRSSWTSANSDQASATTPRLASCR
jgi:fibronectin type 3 domain-containing protein